MGAFSKESLHGNGIDFPSLPIISTSLDIDAALEKLALMFEDKLDATAEETHARIDNDIKDYMDFIYEDENFQWRLRGDLTLAYLWISLAVLIEEWRKASGLGLKRTRKELRKLLDAFEGLGH